VVTAVVVVITEVMTVMSASIAIKKTKAIVVEAEVGAMIRKENIGREVVSRKVIDWGEMN
jgi:hypothetical protein